MSDEDRKKLARLILNIYCLLEAASAAHCLTKAVLPEIEELLKEAEKEK